MVLPGAIASAPLWPIRLTTPGTLDRGQAVGWRRIMDRGDETPGGTGESPRSGGDSRDAQARAEIERAEARAAERARREERRRRRAERKERRGKAKRPGRQGEP